ncbi:uncharacterized protein F4817DRAFT_365385 [Daldinia loculata]|uniref:uncharacterized protein n=1 Tax=Daldinia loculata TaxID=103429 RepID=UPI0020C55C44|nr:uncharacterized protein F4817DRAFT_365385 [Daldinia loculata]KAI1647246.1 hypothetical protein F4817DRAFT_365385 [Daldinia loculata]
MLSRTTRHLAPLRTFTARAPCHPTPLQQLQRPRARFSSSSPVGQEARSPNVSSIPPSLPPSPYQGSLPSIIHPYLRDEKLTSSQAQFYKTFGRPIAKVLLVAVFTYQVAYYFWVRLEQDETRAEMRGTRALPLLLPLPVTPQS